MPSPQGIDLSRSAAFYLARPVAGIVPARLGPGGPVMRVNPRVNLARTLNDALQLPARRKRGGCLNPCLVGPAQSCHGEPAGTDARGSS